MLNISLEEALEAAEAQTEFANEATKDGRGRKEGVGTARGRKRRGGKCCRERSEGASEWRFLPSFLPYMSYQWENVTPLTFYLLAGNGLMLKYTQTRNLHTYVRLPVSQ